VRSGSTVPDALPYGWPTGTPVRRYERECPGEVLHVGVEKIGRLRDRGGRRTRMTIGVVAGQG